MSGNGERIRARWTFGLVFAAVSAGLVAAGFTYYQTYKAQFRVLTERQLSVIAELKAAELVQWRKERLDDGLLFAGNPAFAATVRRLVADPDDIQTRDEIQTWIGKIQSYGQYDQICLLDAGGHLRLSAIRRSEPIGGESVRAALAAQRSGQVALQDFYRSEYDQRVYLAVIAPLLDASDGNRPLGSLVMRIDPTTYLYPFIGRWPTVSASAETLLVRREADEAVFLSPLRFRKDRPLSLRISLQQTQVPAVKAALGQTGAVEGVDYRGVQVFADLRRVPDSPWSMVNRLDTAEAFALLRERLWATVLFVGALVAGAGLALGYARRLQRARFYRERYETAAALQESERKFRALFEHMTEGVALHEIVYDPQGRAVDYRILDVNPAFERHTGLVAAQAQGQLATAVYRTTPPPYFTEFERVARSGEAYDFETFFAGLQKHFHIGVISPKRGVFATIFEDITERKRQERELQEKNAELERFTYTVSHDLKSPLITIKGFAGALLTDLAAGRHERLESDLHRVADAADKMGSLLTDLLELSRIGRIAQPPTAVNLDLLVRDVVRLLAGPIAQHRAEIAIQAGLPVVWADRQRLGEVWQNLIENALKFPGTQTSLRIEIGVRGAETAREFFVRDNGVGIDPRYHETVFGLFNKLDAKSGGTGIGLALVRRIIEVHGGRIWIESAGSNQGTTVCFTLPTTKPTSPSHPS